MAAILSMLWPASVHAQRRVRARPYRPVAVHAVYGGPFFYHPGFYYPAFAGAGWYGYPWGAWGPWPAYGYYGYYDNTSSARIQDAPREAEVYVDGYYAGRVDEFDGVFQSLRLEEGDYQVEIVLPGYEPLAFDVRITPDHTTTYQGELKRIQ
jgi:hypothetical protein